MRLVLQSRKQKVGEVDSSSSYPVSQTHNVNIQCIPTIALRSGGRAHSTRLHFTHSQLHLPSSRFFPNANYQLPFHVPPVFCILRCFCQALPVPILLLLTFDRLSDSCPPNQTIFVPWLAVNRKWSLSRVVEDFEAALFEVRGERVDPPVEMHLGHFAVQDVLMETTSFR